MSLTLVTGPTQEPVTLQEAKDHLRLDTDDDDALVQRLIVAARVWVEGQTHRALMTQTWDQTVDYQYPFIQYRPNIKFEINPVQSVSSFQYADGSSPMPTLAADQYIAVTKDHGSYIVPEYGVSWPTVRCVPEAIRIRFVAGYTDVPEPLKHAIYMLIAHWYENREEVGRGTDLVEPLIAAYR